MSIPLATLVARLIGEERFSEAETLYERIREELSPSAQVALYEFWLETLQSPSSSPTSLHSLLEQAVFGVDDCFRAAALRQKLLYAGDFYQHVACASLFPLTVSHEQQTLAWLVNLCLPSNIDQSKQITQQLQKEGLLNAHQSHLISLHLAHRQGEQALEDEYRRLRQNGVLPNAPVYNYIIGATLTSSSSPLAWEAYNEMELEGLVASPPALMDLLEDTCAQGRSDRAIKLYEELKKQNVVLRKESSQALVGALLREGRYDLAGQLLLDYFPQPSVEVFNQLIEHCCETLQIEKALQLFDVIQERKILPNAQTLDCLLVACQRARRPST